MSKPLDFKGRKFRQTIFLKIREEIDATGTDPAKLILLHVGDTHFDLPRELFQPLDKEPWADHLSRYGDTQGEIELRKRIAEKSLVRNKLPLDGPENVQVTFGATGALMLAMKRLLEPGDEILTLAPYWTILRVVASTAGVKLVEIPTFDRLPAEEDSDGLTGMLRERLTGKTAAVYFNNPNNPSGVLLRRGHLETIARFAKEHDLWVFADEAYEDFVWSDEPYVSIGSLPEMFERTVTIFTMSKSYAAAGLRMGCTVAPTGVTAAINPVHVGVGYEPNRLAQVMWIRAIERRDSILPRLRKAYLEGLDAAVGNLEVPYLRPEGSFYLFLDLRDRWKNITEQEMFRRMVKAGIVMSPGEAFADAYRGWARFCYTAETPDRIAEAAKRVSLL